MSSSSKRTSSKKEGKRTSVFDRLGTSAKTQPSKEVYGSSGSEWPEICRTFAKTGICKFGTSCKYQHVSGKSREEEESSDNKGEYWEDKANAKKHKSKIAEVNLMRPRTIPANQDMENVSSDDSSSFIGYKEWKKKKEKEKMMDFQEVLLLEQQRQKLQQELALELARENDSDVENPPVIPSKKVKESPMTSESSSSYSSSTTSSSSGSSSTSSSSSSDSDSDSPPVKRKKKVAKKQRELPKKKADHKSRQDKMQMETKKKSKPHSFDHSVKKKKAYKDEKKILSKDKKMSKSEVLSSPEPKKKSKSLSHKRKYATQETVKIDKHGKKLGVTPPSGKKIKKAKEKHKSLERKSVTPVKGPELKAHGKQKHTGKESSSHVKSSGQDRDAKSRLVVKKKDKRKSLSSSPERKPRKKLKTSPREEKLEHRKGQQFMKARSASSESHSSQSRDRRSYDKNKEKRRELTPAGKKEKLKKKKAMSQETSNKHRSNDDKIDTHEVYDKKMSRSDFQRGEKVSEKEKHDRFTPDKSRSVKDDKEREHHPPGRPRDLHRDISSDANRSVSRYDQRDRHLDEKGAYNEHDKYQNHPDYSFGDRGRKDYPRPESQRGYSDERNDHRGEFGRYDKNDDHGVSEWDYRSMPLDDRSRPSDDRHASSRDDHSGHSLTHLPLDNRRMPPRDDIRVPPVTERDRRAPPRGSRRGPAPDDRRNAPGDDRRGPQLFDRRGFPISEGKSLLPDDYRDPHPLTERVDDRRGSNFETRLINRHGDPYGPSIPVPLPVDDRYGPVPLLRGELSKPRERPARYERELFDERRELFDERERQDNRARPRDDTAQYEQSELPRRRGGRSRGKGFVNRYNDRMDQEPEGSESYPDYRDRDFSKQRDYRDNRKRPRDEDKSPYGAPPGKRYRDDAWNEDEHWQREGSSREQGGERKREAETDRRKEEHGSRRHDDASPRNDGSEDSKHREKISGEDSRNKQSSRERDYRRKLDDSPRVSTEEQADEHKDIPLEHECSDLALPDDDLLDADIKLPHGEELIGEAFSDVSEENFADDIDKLSEGVNLAVAEAEREVASHLSPRVGEGEQIASALPAGAAEPDQIKGPVEEPSDDKNEATAAIESEMEPISDDELENIFREDDEQKKEEEVENSVPQPKATDLLDVDWASLAQDPTPNLSVSVSARKRFTLANIISRVGISKQFAGEQLVDKLKAACVKELQENGNSDAKFELHSDIALFHVKAELQKGQREIAISDIGPNRKALCARADIEIRRRLCNLSDKIQDQSYTTQTADSELYAQHLTLFKEHMATMAKSNNGIISVETSS